MLNVPLVIKADRVALLELFSRYYYRIRFRFVPSSNESFKFNFDDELGIAIDYFLRIPVIREEKGYKEIEGSFRDLPDDSSEIKGYIGF